MWGPEELEKWILTLSEMEEWYGEVNGGVVIDFDRRRLTWCIAGEALSVPKVAAVYSRLVAQAWPKYEIVSASSCRELTAALGLSTQSLDEQEQLKLEDRAASIWQAMGDDEEENNCDVDDEASSDNDEDDHAYRASEEATYEYGDDELRAWVTITDGDGSIRHRQLLEIPRDLLKCVPHALVDLKQLPSSEVPKEEVVREGMWIEESEKTIGIWGGPRTKSTLPLIERSWKGWDVQWAPRGYSQHCAATGPSGQPLSTEKALAKIVPTILSTDRLDISTFLGAIGGSLKKTAMKATGCLLIVICSPLLIFGAVSGNWKAVLITVGIVIVLVAIVFKLIERGVARSMKNALSRDQGAPTGPATAGPLDAEVRRQSLDQLLAAAGFPAIKTFESLFPPKNALGLPS